MTQSNRSDYQVTQQGAEYSGWLRKLHEANNKSNWDSCWVWIARGHLSYTYSPQAGTSVKRLALEDMPPSKRGNGPQIDLATDITGASIAGNEAGCVFSVSCGRRSHFFAAINLPEAQAWIAALSSAWEAIMLSSARSMRPTASETLVMRDAFWKKEIQVARSINQEQGSNKMIAAGIGTNTINVCHVSIPGLGLGLGPRRTSSGPEAITPPATSQPHKKQSEVAPLVVKNPFTGMGKGTGFLHTHPDYILPPQYDALHVAPATMQQPPGDLISSWPHAPAAVPTAAEPDVSHGITYQPPALNTFGCVPAPAPLDPRFSLPPAFATPQPASNTADEVESIILGGINQDQGESEYMVTLWTGNAPGATTHCSIIIEIRGLAGTTGPIILQNDGYKFTQGAQNEFAFQGPDVGPGIEMAVMLDDGGNPSCAWLLDAVRIVNQSSGESALFECHTWLTGGDTPPLVLVQALTMQQPAYQEVITPQHQLPGMSRQQGWQQHQPPAVQPSMAKVHVPPADPPRSACIVDIATSDAKGAGTLGNAYLTVIGKGGSAGPFLLPNPDGCRFQRGSIDSYTIDDLPAIGTPHRIVLHHDGERLGKKHWRVDSVKITVRSQYQDQQQQHVDAYNEEFKVFECYCWVEGLPEEDETDDMVVGRPLPTTYNNATPNDSLTYRRHADYFASNTSETCRYEDYNEYNETESEAAEYQALGEGTGTGSGEARGYHIAFHTSKGWMSGTRGRPFFEMTGTNGSSGVIKCPRGAAGSFSPGKSDVFTFPKIHNLGHLKRLKVGVDRGSTQSWMSWRRSWHLRAVEVVELGKGGTKWMFPANCWIDGGCDYTKLLRPIPHKQGNNSKERCSYEEERDDSSTPMRRPSLKVPLITATKKKWSGYP